MPPKSASVNKDTVKSRKRKLSHDLPSGSSPKDEHSSATKSKPKKPRAKKEKKKTNSVTNASLLSDPLFDPPQEAANGVAAVVVDEADGAGFVMVDAEPLPEDTVRMSITTDKMPGDGETEITRTTLKLELPANSPDLELPKDTEGVVEAAREMIESAKELQDGTIDSTSTLPSVGTNLKRKADTLEDVEPSGPEEIIQELAEGDVTDLAKVDGEIEMRPAKRTRVMVAAEEYRREKVKRRALVGLSSALAVGVMVPFLSNLF